MSTYADEISAAYAALNDGDVQPFRELLAPEAQWLGTGDHSWDGTTPT
jgi:ketosteroid isomerase-like protein